jgi:hypothetical protein
MLVLARALQLLHAALGCMPLRDAAAAATDGLLASVLCRLQQCALRLQPHAPQLTQHEQLLHGLALAVCELLGGLLGAERLERLARQQQHVAVQPAPLCQPQQQPDAAGSDDDDSQKRRLQRQRQRREARLVRDKRQMCSQPVLRPGWCELDPSAVSSRPAVSSPPAAPPKPQPRQQQQQQQHKKRRRRSNGGAQQQSQQQQQQQQPQQQEQQQLHSLPRRAKLPSKQERQRELQQQREQLHALKQQQDRRARQRKQQADWLASLGSWQPAYRVTGTSPASFDDWELREVEAAVRRIVIPLRVRLPEVWWWLRLGEMRREHLRRSHLQQRRARAALAARRQLRGTLCAFAVAVAAAAACALLVQRLLLLLLAAAAVQDHFWRARLLLQQGVHPNPGPPRRHQEKHRTSELQPQ